MTAPLLNAQIPLDFGVRSAHGRDDFQIGQSNIAAVALVDQWPHWPTPIMTISGAAACGKSHLAAVWAEKAEAVAIKGDALLDHTAEELLRAGSAFYIDGLDIWLDDRDAETTLFHMYNMMKEERKTMLVTMRQSPKHATFAIPDLASRMRGSMVAEILPPDDALLARVLEKHFADRQLKVDDAVIAYLLPLMERSFAAALKIVALADRLSLAEKRNITKPLMRRVLAAYDSE